MQVLRLLHGDCVQRMAELPEGSVDAIVCDPPYGLRFMNKDFDNLGEGAQQREWHAAWLQQAYRVLRARGTIAAFNGTRTHHHLSAAMTKAGFVDLTIRAWTYSTGFPKNHDVSKAMDKAQGVDATVEGKVATYLSDKRIALGLSKAEVDEAVFGGTTRYSWVEGRNGKVYLPTPEEWGKLKDFLHLDDTFDAYIQSAIPSRELRARADGGKGKVVAEVEGDFGYQGTEERWKKNRRLVTPASEQAKRWVGYGTALRPSWEPIVCGRKP